MFCSKVCVAALVLVLLGAPSSFAKVHEVVWDVPANGLQLPSLSTAQCGDVIRFRCPVHVTHGLFKLEQTNYKGECPNNFTRAAGEVLFEPQQACDFTMTLESSPSADFVVTSPVPGACDKNLKMFVHSTCYKEAATFASGMMGDVPALAATRRSTRIRSRFHPPEEPSATETAAASAGPRHPGTRAPGVAPGMAASAELESGAGSLLPAGSNADLPQFMLENAKSGAADVRPLLGSLLLAAAAVLML